jgi:hypothetical protein
MKETYCATCYKRVYGELHKEQGHIVFTMSNGEQVNVDRVFSHGNKYLLEFICCSDHKKIARNPVTGTAVSV